jgi:hypothetical protein
LRLDCRRWIPDWRKEGKFVWCQNSAGFSSSVQTLLPRVKKCCHICIWLVPLLVATLQHLHKSGAFVDSFLIAASKIFCLSGAFVVCRAAILATVLVSCHTAMVCVCCHSSLVAAPPFHIWLVICSLPRHPFLIWPAYSSTPAPPSGCVVV